MEELNDILYKTNERYYKYYVFGEMTEFEFNVRLSVLEDLVDELEGLTEETYDG